MSAAPWRRLPRWCKGLVVAGLVLVVALLACALAFPSQSPCG